MFRRREEGEATKEDSLFGAVEGTAAPIESATVITPPTSSYNPAASTNSYAPAAAAAPAQQPSRPATEPRPAAPTANAFRSNTPMGADLTRNRMPDVKPVSAPVAAAPAAPVAAPAAPSADKAATKPGRRVLTVGNDILLKGEIATCDRLVIEGKVDATLNDVHTVEIAETGSFKGSAHIEDAEISGLFEGDLTVRGRLVIYATGKVRGKISYGEIEIESGGELTGEIKLAGAQAPAARSTRSSAMPSAPAPAPKEAVAA